MSVLEVERDGGVLVLCMNRPDQMNALNSELRQALAETWCEFRESRELEVAILTGTGRAFCAGGDLKESRDARERLSSSNPYDDQTLDKPVIAAINGYAMGGGFSLVEKADLRIAVPGATFEASQAKRLLLGAYSLGFIEALPHAVATEMAFAFRFDAERLYQLGFLNRLVESASLIPVAREMAEHLLTLPPASRVNTLTMMRAMRPRPSAEVEELAGRLHRHGSRDDLAESRRAFAEKRKPQFKGWDDPVDRYHTPTLESLRAERSGESS